MKVFETHLPGVGKRYTISFPTGGEFIVVLHTDGRRQTFWREEDAADSQELFETTESQARKLAEIFDGTYFDGDDHLEEALENARIRWVSVGEDSPVAGQTIRDTGVRSLTGVSIIAIQRGEATLSNPASDTDIRAGDVLVTVGSDESHDEFARLLAGS
ncbi:cation:proton antiporter regulatory subunit [Haloarchaeobius sp. DFWS5]|uniref:cation:proton antiporter regulatory subunit n=1 Tax=Haloarchaeobius sp. DFWS5 TaxID=3446114 RepID=UPI003EBA34CF